MKFQKLLFYRTNNNQYLFFRLLINIEKYKKDWRFNAYSPSINISRFFKNDDDKNKKIKLYETAEKS